MALDKQQASISFAQGVDSKTDPYQVQGKLLLLENGIFTRVNEISKRNGYAGLSKAVYQDAAAQALSMSVIPEVLASGNTIAAFKNEQVVLDGFNAYSYIDSQDKYAYKGPLTVCQLSTRPVLRNISTQAAADSAQVSSGAALYAWEDTTGVTYNGIKASVVDANTGANVLLSNTLISATGTRPRCVAIGQKLVLFWYESGTTSIKYVYVSNGVVSSTLTLVTDVAAAAPAYDASMFSNRIYIAYNSSANTNEQINVTFLTSTLQVGQLGEIPDEKAENCITVFGDIYGTVWIAFANATKVAFLYFNSTLTSYSSAATIEAIGTCHNITGTFNQSLAEDRSQVVILYDFLGSADATSHYSNASINYVTANGGPNFDPAVDTPAVYLRSASLQSKAFGLPFGTDALDEQAYVPHAYVVHDSALQPTYFLTNLYNFSSNPAANIVGKLAAGTAGASPQAIQTRNLLSSVNETATNVFGTALLQKDQLYYSATPTGDTAAFTSSGVMAATADFSVTGVSVTQAGQNLNIGGANLSVYDGANVVEQGFNLFPELISVVSSTTTGSIGNGTYGYAVVYSWTDNQGQLHRSAPSPVKSVTNTGTDTSKNTLTIDTLRITNKVNVSVEVYRTAANGIVYYRLNPATTPLANSKSTDTVSYVDTAADSTITASQQLYTTGGELENIAPPASTIQCVYNNRVVLVPDEDRATWWFSKQVIPGSPPEFTDAFLKSTGSSTGPLTALAQMDSSLILFTSNSILYVQGDGPAPSGGDDNFTQAQAIASDVGCVDARSLVLTPLGLMFQSQKGIYLLSRDMGAKYIGQDVDGFMEDAVVTSANLMASVNQVRFTLDTGIVLMFDYLVGQWSVFTNIDAVSSIVQDGLHVYLKSTGEVLEETPGVFKDGPAPIKLKLSTGWLSFAGLQGYERIYKALILGHFKGAHRLLVKVAYDFNGTATQSTYVDAGDVLAVQTYGSDATYGEESVYGGAHPLYQWRINFTRQKCQAIQLTLEDVAEAGDYNEALSLSAIGLELGIKRGLNKKGASRSFGP